jgi:tRNA threonylcarbamoyladenosine biosynthesis protein TsaB
MGVWSDVEFPQLLSFNEMWTLALDTTTRRSSAALARDGEAIEEVAGDPEQSTATRLPNELMALLARHSLTTSDLGLFGVAIGPGSFTGLRIGIATMQGLAFATRRPLVGISGLDALADIAWRGGRDRVATWVDAWRGEVFVASYETGRETVAPRVARPEAVLAEMADGQETWFTGDGAHTYQDLIVRTLGRAARVAPVPAPLLAGSIARLASIAAAAGERPSPHSISPLYVRRPDAELAKERKRG